jgi:transcriptional regulator with XRE-family HTH domain
VTLIEAIGLAVKRMRERRGLTQAQLAELAKLHPMHISKLERGVVHDVKFTTLFSIADGLSRSGVEGYILDSKTVLTHISVSKIIKKAEKIEAESRQQKERK